MTVTNDQTLQPAVASELIALAAALEPLGEDRWDTPSLCEGWRVREVVAHMTMAARYSPSEFEAELKASNFDFGQLSNRIAARDGARPVSALVADLCSETMQHWAPPGGGYTGALNHAVIHGLDVTVPLGLARTALDSTMLVVLDGMAGGGTHRYFGVDISGYEMRATDLDWTHGSGRPMAGSASDLILAMSGRRSKVHLD